MTDIVEAPRLLAGRVLMSAPTLDEGGEYEGGERFAVARLIDAHIATSLLLEEQDADYPRHHAPLLDIDGGFAVRNDSFFVDKTANMLWLDTHRDPSDTRVDLYLLTSLTVALGLGTVDHWSRRIVWQLPKSIDFEWVPSSTEGHGHLYIDAKVPDQSYWQMLVGFARLGVLEPGFVKAAIARGHSAGRLPWVKKGDLVLSSEVRPEPGPKVTLDDLNQWVVDYDHLDPNPANKRVLR